MAKSYTQDEMTAAVRTTVTRRILTINKRFTVPPPCMALSSLHWPWEEDAVGVGGTTLLRLPLGATSLPHDTLIVPNYVNQYLNRKNTGAGRRNVVLPIKVSKHEAPEWFDVPNEGNVHAQMRAGMLSILGSSHTPEPVATLMNYLTESFHARGHKFGRVFVVGPEDMFHLRSMVSGELPTSAEDRWHNILFVSGMVILAIKDIEPGKFLSLVPGMKEHCMIQEKNLKTVKVGYAGRTARKVMTPVLVKRK
jgi:hypothetical protein